MNKLAAIYARVSSDRQKEDKTIASQTSSLREYAQAHGYAVPEGWIFEDEGYSGAILARPGLERLRDLIAEGQVQAVLVYGPDRLSRKYAYQVLLLEEFSRQGVETVFLLGVSAQTPEERLLVQFQGMIAEYERAQIAERSRRGKRHRAKAGCINVLSGAPYGYRYLKRTESTDACYVVDEAQAAVVREVFTWYTVEGLSIGAIVRRLNDRKVPTRFGKSLMLRKRVWCRLVAQRKQRTTRPAVPSRRPSTFWALPIIGARAGKGSGSFGGRRCGNGSHADSKRSANGVGKAYTSHCASKWSSWVANSKATLGITV